MEKKKQNILLITMGALIVISLIATALTISTNVIGGVCTLIPLVMTALYGFFLYKIPHGNMLKYAIIVLAVAKIISAATYTSIDSSTVLANTLVALCSCAMCYCAGRLNRIEQNKILFPIIEIITLVLGSTWVKPFSDISSVFLNIRSMAYPMIFATIMIAYFVRYKEHREAGLADAPKAK